MKQIIPILIAAILLTSCGGSHSEKAQSKAECDSMLTAYHHADSLYVTCGRIDTLAFQDFINRATAYAEKHPGDSLAADMLYRAGIGSMILAKSADRKGDVESRANNAKRALAIFNQFQEQYPELDQARLCYWQRAIVYDDILGDWRSAESEYRDFINRYPNDSLTPVFQQYLTLLGKTEAEIEEQLAKGQQ